MFNKNDGMAANICDWLFGTLCMPRAGEADCWGLNGYGYGYGYGARNPHQAGKDFSLKPILEAMATARTGI